MSKMPSIAKTINVNTICGWYIFDNYWLFISIFNRLKIYLVVKFLRRECNVCKIIQRANVVYITFVINIFRHTIACLGNPV